MARKKIAKKAKSKKTTAKRATVRATNSSNASLEKNFRSTPSKLVAQCRKELMGLKQQEKKLQSELQKAQQQKKKSQQQVSALTAKQKSKPSATTKKQLTKHNQNLTKYSKILDGLTNRLNDVKTQSRNATQNQNKHIALNKMLAAFDKDWSAKQKKAELATSKPRKKTQKKAKPTTQQPTQENTPAINDETIVTTQRDFEIVE